MSPLHQAIAAEVRAYLARRQLTGVATARRLGWTQNYMSRRLSGTAPFSLDDLQAVADLLEVPVTAFFDVPGSISRFINAPAGRRAAA